MRITDQQIIKAIRTGLKRLGADLAGTDSAHLVQLLDIAISELAARSDGRIDDMLNACAEAARIATRGAALAERIDAPEFANRVRTIDSLNPSDPGSIATRYDSLRQLLVDCTLALHAALHGGKGDTAWRDEVRAFFLALARHEAGYATTIATPPAGDHEESPAAPANEQIKVYFSRCNGNARLPGPFEVIEVKAISGGFSRQTFKVRLRDAGQRERLVIVRKQVPGGFLDGACNTLAEEIPFHLLANRYNLPVPELFWHETDTSHLGADFVVMSFVEGAILGASYTMADTLDERFFRQLADILARMHRIDWSPFEAELRAASRIPAAAPCDAEHATRAMIAQFEGYWRNARLEPLPLMELVVDWMKANVPPSRRPAVLCHADIGFHNLLIQNGRITALLDWECSRLADPAREIAYVRTMVSHYMDWQTFLGWYRDAGGPDIDQASLDFHEIFCKFASVITTDVAMGYSFPRTTQPNLEYLRLAYPVRAYFLNELLRAGRPIWGKAI